MNDFAIPLQLSFKYNKRKQMSVTATKKQMNQYPTGGPLNKTVQNK